MRTMSSVDSTTCKTDPRVALWMSGDHEKMMKIS